MSCWPTWSHVASCWARAESAGGPPRCVPGPLVGCWRVAGKLRCILGVSTRETATARGRQWQPCAAQGGLGRYCGRLLPGWRHQARPPSETGLRCAAQCTRCALGAEHQSACFRLRASAWATSDPGSAWMGAGTVPGMSPGLHKRCTRSGSPDRSSALRVELFRAQGSERPAQARALHEGSVMLVGEYRRAPGSFGGAAVLLSAAMACCKSAQFARN